MTPLQKVLWSEGQFLTPHHFQQWDRYHEDVLNFRIRALSTFMWGAEELKFNEEALENGIFEVLRCRAVLPDGMAVDVPDVDQEEIAGLVKACPKVRFILVNGSGYVNSSLG